MALSKEQIEKYRKLYAESTNDTVKNTAKAKLEAENIPLTEPKEKKITPPAGSLTDKQAAKKYDMSEEDIQKLRRILENSTNPTAKATAKEKLEKAGVPLTGGENKPAEQAAAPTKAAKSKGQHASQSVFEAAVMGKLFHAKMPVSEIQEAVKDQHLQAIIKEGFAEKWSAIFTAKQMKKAMTAKAKTPDKADEFDCDTLIAKAKAQAVTRKAAAERRKTAPKKTPATKNKEAVAKTSERVVKNVETRAKKQKVSVSEIDKMISEYQAAIKKLQALRAKIASGKKFAEGGAVDGELDDEAQAEYDAIKAECGCKLELGGKVPADETYYIDFLNKDKGHQQDRKVFKGKNAYEKAVNWGKAHLDNYNADMVKIEFGNGGGIKEDKHYSAEKGGERHSKKYATVEIRGGGRYTRRNANQFGQVKGGGEYHENRENRSDHKKYFAEGGKVKGWKHKKKKA